LCPVRAAAAIVRRIRSYPGANDDTPFSAIRQYDRFEHITSRQIKNALQDAIAAIGEDTLHIAVNETGTLSIRSDAAMVMFLGGFPVFLIVMIGCWSSDAFLHYIRKQVEEFNHDVSRKMITTMFHRHISNYTSLTVSHLDPRQRNHPDNIKIQRNEGGAWLDKPGCLLLPSLTEHYDQTFGKTFHLFSPANSPSHTDPWKYKKGGSTSFDADGVG
jgi:hypothetical protein